MGALFEEPVTLTHVHIISRDEVFGMKFSSAVYVKYMAELQFFARNVHWGNSYLGILKSYRVRMHLNVLETFITTDIFNIYYCNY